MALYCGEHQLMLLSLRKLNMSFSCKSVKDIDIIFQNPWTDPCMAFYNDRGILIWQAMLSVTYLPPPLMFWVQFQHCTGLITTGSFVGRGNQYIQLVKALSCNLPTIGKQLPTFPHKVWDLNHQPERWEASVLPLHHCGPSQINEPNYATGNFVRKNLEAHNFFFKSSV